MNQPTPENHNARAARCLGLPNGVRSAPGTRLLLQTPRAPGPRISPGGQSQALGGAWRGVAGRALWGGGGTGTPQTPAQVSSVPGVVAGGGARSPWRRLPRGRGGRVPERREGASLWAAARSPGGLRAGPRCGAGERGIRGGARSWAVPGQQADAGRARGRGVPGAGAGPAAARAPSANSHSPSQPKLWRAGVCCAPRGRRCKSSRIPAAPCWRVGLRMESGTSAAAGPRTACARCPWPPFSLVTRG